MECRVSFVRSLAVCIAALMAPMAGAMAAETAASSETGLPVKLPVPVVWKSWPGPETTIRYTPERAQRYGVGGWALVDCLVAEDGTVTDCDAWAVSAKDWAFDVAASRLLSNVRPRIDLTAPGAEQMVGKAVRFAVVFRVDYPQFKRSQLNKPLPIPAVCFPKDDGSVSIISTPQFVDPPPPIRRC
jgi:hypothetical protein